MCVYRQPDLDTCVSTRNVPESITLNLVAYVPTRTTTSPSFSIERNFLMITNTVVFEFPLVDSFVNRKH